MAYHIVNFDHSVPDDLAEDVVDCDPGLTSLFIQGADHGEPEIAVTWKMGLNSASNCDNVSYSLQLGTCLPTGLRTFCNETLFNTSHADVLLHKDCPMLVNQPVFVSIEIKSEMGDMRNSTFVILDLVNTSK